MSENTKTKFHRYFIILVKLRKKNKNVSLLLLLSIVIYTYNYYSKNNIKICLCAIAKNEILYIREFVEHYKKIGYNKIIIYDNNDEKDENIEEAIEDYIQNGFVKIIKLRVTNPDIIPQFYAYKDCYSRYNKFFDWLSFYDVDEFLEIDKKYNLIQDFLKDKTFEKCKNIKINWLIYFDKNILYYENKPVQERIRKYNYNDPSNIHIKSTVRGNLSKNYWEKMLTPHSSELKFTSCSSSGKKIKYDSPYNIPPDYTNAFLKHYKNKSFEEYCYKLKRGRADVNKTLSKVKFNNAYKYLLLKSKGNIEKSKIIYKIFENQTIID